ncbi:MAG: hypothetical protein ACREL2_01010 [Gemmatimonadales bacterium]
MTYRVQQAIVAVAAALGIACASTGPTSAADTWPQLVAAHPLAGQPYGVAVASTGEGYVTRLSAGLLARVDVAAGTVDDSAATTATAPTGVTFLPNGSAAFVADQGSTGVERVSAGTGHVDTTIAFTGDLFQAAAGPDGTRVYVTGNTGYVYAIDPSSNAIVDSVGLGGSTNGMAFSPDGQSMFVDNLTNGTICRIRLSSLTVDQVDTIVGRTQGIAVSPDGAELWVADQDADSVYVVSTATRQVLASIWVGQPFGLAMRPGTDQVWITTLDGYVLVLDRAARAAVGVLPVGGVLRRIAFTVDGSRAVVADGAGRVLILK